MRLSTARWEKERWGALNDTQFDLYVMPAAGGEPRRLTSSPGHDLWLAWSPDGKWLAFSSTRDGTTDLYLLEVDGAETRRLTRGPASESGPSWSPDGRTIAYAAKQGGPYQLWLMNADGTEPRRLATSAADDENPVFSPDGTQLVFYSNRAGRGQDQVYVIDARGGEPRLVGPGVFPAWAPDGRTIIYGHGREGLFSIGLDGSTPHRLADDGEFGRWSPDGTRIAYIGGQPPSQAIYVMRGDGTGRVRLTR
jgi:Tol biopolymer transport system component